MVAGVGMMSRRMLTDVHAGAMSVHKVSVESKSLKNILKQIYKDTLYQIVRLQIFACCLWGVRKPMGDDLSIVLGRVFNSRLGSSATLHVPCMTCTQPLLGLYLHLDLLSKVYLQSLLQSLSYS